MLIAEGVQKYRIALAEGVQKYQAEEVWGYGYEAAVLRCLSAINLENLLQVC
jgi:hypothetical protein